MELREGDYGYDIEFTITEEDGETAVDLTGASSIVFSVMEAATNRNKINGACTVTTASEGKCKYTVAVNDFKTSGNFVGAVRIIYSDKSITTKDIAIYVAKKLY